VHQAMVEPAELDEVLERGLSPAPVLDVVALDEPALVASGEPAAAVPGPERPVQRRGNLAGRTSHRQRMALVVLHQRDEGGIAGQAPCTSAPARADRRSSMGRSVGPACSNMCSIVQMRVRGGKDIRRWNVEFAHRHGGQLHQARPGPRSGSGV